jgi:hypothetical protein
MSKELGIGFGPLCDPIPKQLKQQGFKYNHDTAKEFEQHRQSVIDLMFGNVLSDSQVDMAYKKLFAQIRKHVISKNKT